MSAATIERGLDRALEDLAREVSAPGFHCRAGATEQGNVIFVVDTAAGRARILVSPRDYDDVDYARLQAGDFWLYLLEAQANPSLLTTMAERLAAARESGAAGWFCTRNREHRQVEAEAGGLLGLLAELVAVERPFWHGWRLAEIYRTPKHGARLMIALARGQAPRLERLLLALEPSGRPGSDEVPLVSTPLGLLLRCRGQAEAEHQPERALALALALTVHAEMRWREPVAEGSRDTLLDHCYRTAHAWDAGASRFFGTWGDRDFFSMLALFGQSERGAQWVFHGSRECPITRGLLSGVVEHGRTPWVLPDLPLASFVDTATMTDVDDTAVVFGGEQRLEEALALAQVEAGGAEVQVTLGCDYHVIGDDVEGICRCFNERGAGRVQLLNPPLPRFTDATTRNWWRTLSLPQHVGGSDAAVNLAGFGRPGSTVMRELTELLEWAGVTVRSVFFPGWDASLRTRAHEAALTVVSPWAPVQDALVPVLEEWGHEIISPPGPYGPRATGEWLVAILNRLGLETPAPERWQTHCGALAPHLAGMREMAGDITVAWVADWGSALELCSPRFFFGFDPIALCLDLGFSVHLVAAEAGAAAARYPGARLRTSELGGGQDPWDLIAAAEPRLIYCDVGSARAVKRRGLTPFDIGALEPGVRGAHRTATRLLALARQQLYRDYHRYLAGDVDAA